MHEQKHERKRVFSSFSNRKSKISNGEESEKKEKKRKKKINRHKACSEILPNA